MSLQPALPSDHVIPEETTRAARAAFPRGNCYLRLRDELGTLFEDADFAALYSHRGQPTYSPWRLALVTVMQYMENLSDRQAADAVRARLDWKYALGLSHGDAGFDASVLCEFRSRLVRAGAESLLLDVMLGRLVDAGLLKARGKQRSDATHVLAAVRQLNRLELLGETLRAALNEMAEHAPERLRSLMPLMQPEWQDRYARRVEETRLPRSKAKRKAYAEAVGRDGFLLLEAFEQEEVHLRNLPMLSALRAVWHDHFERSEDGVVQLAERRAGKRGTGKKKRTRKSTAGEGGSSEDSSSIKSPDVVVPVESPYDPEARFCNRRGTKWVGYRVHLTETCDQARPRIIGYRPESRKNIR